jgi:hypothetical protein
VCPFVIIVAATIAVDIPVIAAVIPMTVRPLAGGGLRVPQPRACAQHVHLLDGDLIAPLIYSLFLLLLLLPALLAPNVAASPPARGHPTRAPRNWPVHTIAISGIVVAVTIAVMVAVMLPL